MALKSAWISEIINTLTRSRNAVVALKSGPPKFSVPTRKEKQERRGGIEIRPAILSKIQPETKQERRGGIEIAPVFRHYNAHNSGSRNAVVALKSPTPTPIPTPPAAKQERRGGIEIQNAPQSSTTDTTKQERRGGIEIEARIPIRSPLKPEAGTPWWH